MLHGDPFPGRLFFRRDADPLAPAVGILGNEFPVDPLHALRFANVGRLGLGDNVREVFRIGHVGLLRKDYGSDRGFGSRTTSDQRPFQRLEASFTHCL